MLDGFAEARIVNIAPFALLEYLSPGLGLRVSLFKTSRTIINHLRMSYANDEGANFISAGEDRVKV